MTRRKAPARKARKSRKAPERRGRARHEPTQASRVLVRYLYVGGRTQDQIAPLVGCDPTTLRRYYRAELDLGKAEVDAMVTRTIVQKCLGGSGTADDAYDWRRADTHLLAFYAARRMGWKEPKQEINHSGAVGNYDLSKLSDAELKRVDELLARAEILSPNDNPG